MPGILSRQRKERIPPLELGGGNGAPLDVGGNLPTVQETWVQSLVWEDPLEKGKATHFSILAWRIPWAV